MRHKPAKLSQSALDVVATEPRETAYSPIVVSGFVRAIEFALIIVVGRVLYLAYLGPKAELPWAYASAILTIATLCVLAFQSAELYDIHAFRRPINQMAKLVSAWSMVFLLGTAVTFFGKLGEEFSRVWFASFFGFGLFALMASRLALYTVVRSWMRQGRLTRRTVVVGGGEHGEGLIRVLRTQPDSDVRVIGIFDDRGDDRSPDTCGGLKKLGTRRRFHRILAPHPRRSCRLLAADLGRKPHPADAQKALGAADRHSSLGA